MYMKMLNVYKPKQNCCVYKLLTGHLQIRSILHTLDSTVIASASLFIMQVLVKIIIHYQSLTFLLSLLFACKYHFVEHWNTKQHIKHVFNTAINNRWYFVNYYYICKLSFMNVQIDLMDRQADRENSCTQ